MSADSKDRTTAGAAGPRAGSRIAVVAVLGATAIWAGAQVTVPMEPVPMTLQTLAVLIVGGLGGPLAGAAAGALYLALGLAGAPIFADGATAAGLAFLEMKSGGYIVAFAPAAALAGMGRHREAVEEVATPRMAPTNRLAALSNPTNGATMRAGRRLARRSVGTTREAATSSTASWRSRPLRLFGTMLAAHALILALGGAWLAAHIGAPLAIEHGVTPFLLGAVGKSLAAALVIVLVRSTLRR